MQANDPAAVARAIRVKDAAAERLLALPGVHGVGVGARYRKGSPTHELALVVFVDRKRPLDRIPPGEAIPSEIDGLPTDVQEAPRAEYCDDAAKYRPLRGGAKLQWTEVTRPAPNTIVRNKLTGTLACAARSRKTGKVVLLTNAHVVAGCDNPAVAIGRRIGQPDDDSDYTCCSKSWATVVGTVVDARKDPANRDVDVALIELDKCVDTLPQVIGAGAIHGALNTDQLNALSGTQVRWRGYRTETVRDGVVEAPSFNSFILCTPHDPSLPRVTHSFRDVITVRVRNPNDVLSGDSGSLVMDLSGHVVGLLFGRAGNIAYVCRWDNILATFLERWDLELLTNPGIDIADVAPSSPRLLGAAGMADHRDVFSPSAAETSLLEGARDEVLATPEGSRLVTLVSRHADEIRSLIRREKRVAAVWHRVATPELPHALLAALREPERPLPELVEGAPLPERAEALRRVLDRYGSPALRADLARLAPLALDLASRSVAGLRAWLHAPTHHA